MNIFSTHTLTSKGQVTIPKVLRDKIGLKPGAQASLTLLDDHTIAIRTPMTSREVRALVGEPSHKQPLTAKESERLAARDLLA
mgnify:CR=1 FL=1